MKDLRKNTQQYAGSKEKYWILCLTFYEELRFFTTDFNFILEELFEKQLLAAGVSY